MDLVEEYIAEQMLEKKFCSNVAPSTGHPLPLHHNNKAKLLFGLFKQFLDLNSDNTF